MYLRLQEHMNFSEINWGFNLGAGKEVGVGGKGLCNTVAPVRQPDFSDHIEFNTFNSDFHVAVIVM